jgi:hypothetical protein
MWIAKGVSVGTILFVFLSVVYVVLAVSLSSARAVGTTALYGMTLRNPLYWAAFLVVLAVSCVFFRQHR